jgi:hypothetical protein
VFLPDGSLLHLDNDTTVDLLSGSLMRLTSGRIIIIVSGRSDSRPSLDYQIDAAAGSARIVRPGEYRLSLVQGRPGPDLELAVVRGEATLATDRGSVDILAGQYSTAMDGYAPVYPVVFNSAKLDAFARWSADQLDAHLGYASQQYLPPEVQVYSSTFDQYGTWEDVQPYGYVWYPTVQVGWRPYYDGYWRTVGPYGWTWIGYDPWCWPTHHYGRWGMGARGWFWIPGRSWGSAWVSWGIGADYVSWCPLGWNNHAVFGLSFGGYYVGGHHYDPWSAWTVVPRRAFGGPARVPAVALHGDALTAAARTGFAVQRTAPAAMVRPGARPFAAAGGANAHAVPRAMPGAAGTSPAPAYARRGAVAPRTAQPANGMPARDSRPTAFERTPAVPASPAPSAVQRPRDTTITTYDRMQTSTDWNVRASEPAARAQRRVPETLGDVATETNAARRSIDPAQRDAGTRVYRSTPAGYPAPSPQNDERGAGAAAVPRSPAQSWSQGARSVPSASAPGRQAPEQVAAPRSPDRSWSTGSRPSQAVAAYERRVPAPMAAPRAPERSSGPAPQVSRPQHVAPPSGAAGPPRPSSPAVERAPRPSAPASRPGRGGSAGGAPRRR